MTNIEISAADRDAVKCLYEMVLAAHGEGMPLDDCHDIWHQAFARHRLAATAAERERWLAACQRVSSDSAREESDETFHEGRMTACAAVVQLATT
jgi:hypothetical protein